MITFLLSGFAGMLIIARQGIYLNGLPLVLAWLAFAGWACLTATWTPVHGEYLLTKIRDIAIVNSWTVIGSALILANSRVRIGRFLLFLLLISILTTLILVFKYASFSAYVPLSKSSHHFARLAAIGAIITYVYFTYSKVLSPMWSLASTLLLMFLVSLLMIGTRSLMIITYILLILPAVLGLPKGRPDELPVYRSQVQVILIVVGILAVGGTLVAAATELPWTLRRFSKLLETDGDSAGLLENRRFYFYYVATMAWDRAVFFGHGIASFPFILGIDPSKRSFPHNVFLEAVSELGLVGGMLLLLVVIICFRSIPPIRLRKEPLMLMCAMLGILSISYCMISGDIPNLDYVLLFFGLSQMRRPGSRVAKYMTVKRWEAIKTLTRS